MTLPCLHLALCPSSCFFLLLSQVRWGKMGEVLKDHRLLVLATVLNWVLGPLLMFVLSLAFFHDSSPGFMAGLSLVR